MGYGNEEVFLTPRQRRELVDSLMGKQVDVVIDRPIGHTHVTKGITLHYTINYGYLPGITGGDGEEQDVYILGVEEPLETFTGRIIAAVLRADDNEDKLVAAPEGMTFSQADIEEAIRFVEKYFDSEIVLYQENRTINPLSLEKADYLFVGRGHDPADALSTSITA